MKADERYSRQILFQGLGAAGQERLGKGAALLVGCGALGTHVAELLVRSGIGLLRIIDRDFVEESNLHRQSLFEEADVRLGLPKAIAAANRLRAINASCRIEPFAEQLDVDNIERLFRKMQLAVDGTDNFETRFLINDFSLKNRLPWIYGACVGAYGLTMNIIPGETPCLRCLLGALPEPGSTATCDTAGVIPPAPAFIAALQATEAIKILSGSLSEASRDVVAADLWSNTMQRFRIERQAVSIDCVACERGEYEYLEGKWGMRSFVLCGRNAVQIRPQSSAVADLERIAAGLSAHGQVVKNQFMLRAEVEGYVLAVFPDGRAIISGTSDPVRARSLYDRFVGA